MLFTFKLNTVTRKKWQAVIEEWNKKHPDKSFNKDDADKLWFIIQSKAGVEFKLHARNEDYAWEELDKLVEPSNLEDEIELADTEYSDEIEAEEAARDRYIALQEDIAVERAHGIY